MIYTDRAIAVIPGEEEYDAHGNAIPGQPVEYPVACSIYPLNTSETVEPGGTKVVTRYRVILPPNVIPLDKFSTDIVVQWQGYDLTIDGNVERHSLRGSLHHIEFTTKDITY